MLTSVQVGKIFPQLGRDAFLLSVVSKVTTSLSLGLSGLTVLPSKHHQVLGNGTTSTSTSPSVPQLSLVAGMSAGTGSMRRHFRIPTSLKKGKEGTSPHPPPDNQKDPPLNGLFRHPPSRTHLSQ